MEDTQTGAAAPTAEQVREALRVVIDPELGISIVDLGLLYDLDVEEDVVKLTYSLTSIGCPVGPHIEEQMRAVVDALPGVDRLEATLVFQPPWTVERMSEEARLAMGMF